MPLKRVLEILVVTPVVFFPSEHGGRTIKSFNLLYQTRFSGAQKVIDQRLNLGQSVAGAWPRQVWLLPADCDQIGGNLLANGTGSVDLPAVLHTAIEVTEDVDARHLSAIVKAALEVEDLILLPDMHRVVAPETVANVDHKKEDFGVRLPPIRYLVKSRGLAKLVYRVCLAHVLIQDLVKVH